MQPLKPLNQAMEYIEQNLAGEIDFNRLAQLAGCSEYQFRRIFAFLSGMSLGEYIRLRRLSEAATELAQEGGRVLDIAIKYGYESPDAFARAFQALHGIPPSEAKKGQGPLKLVAPMTFQLTIQGGKEMEYRIVEKGAFRIVGLNKQVPLQHRGVNQEIVAMTQGLTPAIITELKAMSNQEPRGIISASVHLEESMAEGTMLDHYIGVATDQPCPDRYHSLEVSPGSWAVFTVRGPFPETLQNTWARIYSEWLQVADYEIAPGPSIVWHQSPDTTNPNYHSEIWIKVVKKG